MHTKVCELDLRTEQVAGVAPGDVTAAGYRIVQLDLSDLSPASEVALGPRSPRRHRRSVQAPRVQLPSAFELRIGPLEGQDRELEDRAHGRSGLRARKPESCIEVQGLALHHREKAENGRPRCPAGRASRTSGIESLELLNEGAVDKSCRGEKKMSPVHHPHAEGRVVLLPTRNLFDWDDAACEPAGKNSAEFCFGSLYASRSVGVGGRNAGSADSWSFPA